MNSDINDAAANVLELTNKLGAAAADMHHATQAARMARETAAVAARHPGRLAAWRQGCWPLRACLPCAASGRQGQAWRGPQETTAVVVVDFGDRAADRDLRQVRLA